ncbi:MAG: DUF4142 domain-containing protein [Terriglobales bacterium]
MAQAPRPSAKDTGFLQEVAQEDRSELDLAKLALQKSSDPQVRSYAQSILANDPQVERDAQKLAPSTTQATTSQSSAEYQKLAKLSSREFDQEYMRYEAARQEQDLRSLVNEIDTTDDANLLDFGIKAEVPTQQAEQQAEQLASRLGGSMSVKNAPPRRHS